VAEPELGPLFRKADADLPRLDVEVILAKSRRRRRPRVAAVASVLGLAVIGILGTGAYGLGHLVVGTSGSASSAVSAPAAQPSPATCGAVTAPIPSSAHALTATVRFGAAYAGKPARGTVTLVNSGASTVTGTVGSPTVTLSKAGHPVWRTTAADSKGHSVSLGPGKSTTLEADIPGSECAPAGQYQIVAAVTVDVDNGRVLTVTSTPSTLSIRP
jgi:hypothetical protein